MTAFSSFGALASHLAEREIAARGVLEVGLDRLLPKIQHKAESQPGEYQPAVGPFPAWAQLSEVTEDLKAEKGYPMDAPLYATGGLKDSFRHSREGLVGYVGSTDEKMVFHEFGTVKMPPRPVLGPAGFSSKNMILKMAGAAALAGIIGEDQVHRALGYDINVLPNTP